MKLRTDKIAVVFGLFETGLGVIRALGRKGIPVLGVDYKKDIAWYSRYVEPLQCPHPIDQRQDFIQWLQKYFKEAESSVAAFITGDDFLYTLSEARQQLSGILCFNMPSDELLKKIADKYRQYTLAYKAGIDVPATWLLESAESMEVLRTNEYWPLIIKGRDVNSWREVYGGTVKGFIVGNFQELIEKVMQPIKAGVPVIAQEIIQGPDTNHYKYCAYISQNGETLAELTLRKIRQWPVRFGVGAVVESVQNRELTEAGRKFFKAIDYRGVGSAEFKWDERDDKLKLIELNTRYWQQNALAEACGVNFAYLHYQDLLGATPKSVLAQTDGIKWINRYMDLSSYLQYHREGLLSFRSWRKSLKGKKVYADFAWDDPLPAFSEICFGMKIFRLPKYLRKRLF